MRTKLLSLFVCGGLLALQVQASAADDRSPVGPAQGVGLFKELCIDGETKTSNIERAIQDAETYAKNNAAAGLGTLVAKHRTLKIEVEGMPDRMCSVTFIGEGPDVQSAKDAVAKLLDLVDGASVVDQKDDGSALVATPKGKVVVANFSKLMPNAIKIMLQ